VNVRPSPFQLIGSREDAAPAGMLRVQASRRRRTSDMAAL
jgi:hypothetical protein